MPSKIIDLRDTAQSSEHLDKETMFNVLENLFSKNEGAIWDYADEIAKLVYKIGLWRDILLTISNRQRCESLIASLDEEQMQHFSRIVLSLKRSIESDNYNDICDALFNIRSPTPESIKKAESLINITSKVKDVDFNKLIGGLFNFSFEIKMLAKFFYDCKTGKCSEDLVNSLSRLSENELDSMINLSNLAIEFKIKNLL